MFTRSSEVLIPGRKPAIPWNRSSFESNGSSLVGSGGRVRVVEKAEMSLGHSQSALHRALTVNLRHLRWAGRFVPWGGAQADPALASLKKT